eukprot:gnl/MRDRNA2_/MRDRNA2_57811_c0_seq1.p1 gnl/MRDRNA2_/MRDRNA2_57811_c0~~gnl/MRDRNA2_/MRDRNA2_57811_c0_seq1.p1  ORF type:complete len:289 (+),score=47.06 gnl/MRDRNA2_/MRDRNA2_57811_c0_seq1:73-939(+)
MDRVADEPESLVILTDGGDVAFGGCSQQDLLDRYQTVVHASGGAQVVVGADHWVWPYHANITKSDYNDYFKARKAAVLAAFDDHDLDLYDGAEYSYVNSGFIMGPLQKVLDILTCMSRKRRGWLREKFHDQLALATCMFLRPQDVAIDYSGLLVLDYNGLPKDSLVGRNDAVYNTAYQRVQCFIHFNGWCPQRERARLAEWGLGPTDDEWWAPLIETSRWCGGAQEEEQEKWILSRHINLLTGFNPPLQVMMAAAAILLVSLCLCYKIERVASAVELAPLVGQDSECE